MIFVADAFDKGSCKDERTALGNCRHRSPNWYTAGIGFSPMDFIHQSLSISIDIVEQGAHTCFGTALADGDKIPAQPWI